MGISIQKIAARHRANVFSVGDTVLYGKWKNKRGKVIRFFKDGRGVPYLEIEPIPKGRKKNKIMGLYKIWKTKEYRQREQEQEAEEAAAHMKLGCIIAGKKFDKEICLFKNRDRAYDSEVEVVHLENNGIESAVIFDPKTGYIEGVNEHGIGVVNTALAVLHDEMEGKDKAKSDKGKGPMKSRDGPKIFKALGTKTLKEALHILITEDGGIKGHTFLSDGKTLICIECSRTHPARVTRLDPKRTNTRTNHGISYPDAGYTHGDDYISSIVRRWEAQKRIQEVKHPEDIGPALMEPIHKKDSPFNPVRDTDKMRTTSQLVINTTNPRLFLYLIPGHGSLKRIRNMLPENRDPKIPVRVIQYEGEDDVVKEKAPSIASRVAARYKSKTKIKTKDGDEMIVYEYSDQQVSKRNRDKAKRIEKLRKSMGKLMSKVRKDVKAKDEVVRDVAMAVGLMAETFERIGNDASAKEGHFGVTTWRAKHVRFSKGTATISYVGKSGVDQKKKVTDSLLIGMLKKSLKGKKPDDLILNVSPSAVNKYLKPFGISAKDIRGYHANTEMKAQLRKVRKGKLSKDPKERKKKLKEEFKVALENTADRVGHEPSTLKSQYLVPGLEDDYIKDGTINDSLTKKGAEVGTDTATIVAIAPEMLRNLYTDPKFQTLMQLFGGSGHGDYADWRRMIQEHGGAVFETGSDGSFDVKIVPEPMGSHEYGLRPPYGTAEFGKSGGRKEKEEFDREDEQVQKMLRKEPKKKPPRYDLRDNRTLKERDKDLEGLDKDDAGDKDLQDHVRRYARRIAFRWLAIPLQPSAVRIAALKFANPPPINNRGKHWQSPNTPDVWIGQNQDGDTRGFKSEEAAKRFSRGTKAEKDEKPKKDKGKKDLPPASEETAPTDEEDEPGVDKPEPETKVDEDLSQAKQDVDDQQETVDDMMKDLESVEDDKREKLEEEIIAERAELKKRKNLVKDIESPPEEAKPEAGKPEAKPEAKPEEKPKTQSPEDKRDEIEGKVNELQKQLDENKDAAGDLLLEDERPKVEEELSKVREELGKVNESISKEDASKQENERTEQLSEELHAKEKEKNPRTTKTKEDFASKAREMAQKEKAKYLTERNITEAEQTIESIIGPGSGLDKDVRESLTTALSVLDKEGQAEFSAALKNDLASLVEDTRGTSKAGVEVANRAATREGYDGITDPKKLGKAVAQAAYARNVVANPKILGGTPISETEKTAEELSTRAMEATTHYRQLDHSLRQGAAQTLVDELVDMDPKSNRAKEINVILTGIALAAAVEGNTTELPGRPQPSEKAIKLVQAMDRQGNLEQMLKPMEDLTSPEGRQAIADALGDMSDTDLIDQVTGGDSSHPFGEFADLLEDDDIDPVVKQVLREALIGMTTDEMSYLDRGVREITGEQDPKKRADIIRATQESKESRAFISGIVDAAKSGESLTKLFPELDSEESGDEKDEGPSLLDAMRAQSVSNFLQQHSDAVEENKTAPSVAVLREVATSRNTSAMDSEVKPHPEEFWATQRDKKTASESQFSGYRRTNISEGPSDFQIDYCGCDRAPPRPAPPARRQSSMTTLTETGARQVTADLDRLATLFQNDHHTLGIPAKVAEDMALRCDMLSDRIETQAGLRPREAAMDPPANYTEEDVKPNEFNPAEIGEEQSGALLRNEDEPYMDVFRQDEFDQLREVQQEGMFSNAKTGAELIKKMVAALRVANHPQFSAQKKSDLNAGAVEASTDELTKLADSLDRLGNLEDITAKFHEAAGLGKWNDLQAETAVKQLTELERDLVDAEAEIEALAGEVLKRKTALEKDYKAKLTTLKKELPETLKGQGKEIISIRQAIIKYTKVSEQKRPGAIQMIEELNADPDAPIKDRGGDLIGRVEDKLGAVIAKEVEEIYDTVMEELTVLRPVVRGLKLELQQKNASEKEAAEKEAGLMSLLVKFRDWVLFKFDKLKRLFGMGTKRIDNAGVRIEKAIKDAEKGWDMVLKHASEDPKTAGEIPEAFKENIQKMKDKAKDKKDDEKSDDKKDDEKSDDKKSDDKKASEHGYELSA